MRVRLVLIVALGFSCAVAAYAAGLATGAITLVGYASGTERQQGFSATRWFPIRIDAPMWLDAGSVIQADFEVDAEFGALSLSVSPPLILRSPLQAATAFVAGKRKGSVLFVTQVAGWYSLRTRPTPVSGRRCPRERSMAEVMIGSSDCPTFDVSYRVIWRLAGGGRPPAGAPRLVIPRPHETLATLRIGE